MHIWSKPKTLWEIRLDLVWLSLTHSSFPSSAGFPSGCCRLKLWPSGHCLSESLATNQHREKSEPQSLTCSRKAKKEKKKVRPWRWSLRCFSGTVWLDTWPCPTGICWYRWPGQLWRIETRLKSSVLITRCVIRNAITRNCFWHVHLWWLFLWLYPVQSLCTAPLSATEGK